MPPVAVPVIVTLLPIAMLVALMVVLLVRGAVTVTEKSFVTVVPSLSLTFERRSYVPASLRVSDMAFVVEKAFTVL